MSNKPNTVIYHRADFDGIFCLEVAKHFLGDTAEYIGWDYADPKIPFPDSGTVYVLDLSPDCFTLTKDNLPTRADGGFDGTFYRLIWIDHHKSAIEKYTAYINGYRIDGVAACRLTWQWFQVLEHNAQNSTNEALRIALPDKQAFIDRTVPEPLAVRLAGEYDIWDKRDTRSDLFQLGLRSCDLTEFWPVLLGTDHFAEDVVKTLLETGKPIQYSMNQSAAQNVRENGYLQEFEGLKFLTLNTPSKGSMMFAARDVPETGHHALMKYHFNGRSWEFSMYHSKHRSDIDLSLIAAKHGGGGHRGACGFRAEKLPF